MKIAIVFVGIAALIVVGAFCLSALAWTIGEIHHRAMTRRLEAETLKLQQEEALERMRNAAIFTPPRPREPQ